MKAIQFVSFGGPDAITVAETAEPSPGIGDVLIRVSHSGVNFAEVMFRRGQIRVELPHVPGLEACGVVGAVGPDVEGIRVGDRVAALTLAGGGQGELAVADARFTVVLDDDLAGISNEKAASVLCNGTTAVGAIELWARPQPGDRVLITAAAGGVGGCLIDLLAETGTYLVAATSDPRKIDQHRRDQLAELLDYAQIGDSGPFDVVFDSVGGQVRRAIRDRISMRGRHIIMGDASQDDTAIPCNSLWMGGNALLGYNLGALANGEPQLLRQHMRQALLEGRNGKLRGNATLIAPEQVSRAHQTLEDRTSSGKFVVAW